MQLLVHSGGTTLEATPLARSEPGTEVTYPGSATYDLQRSSQVESTRVVYDDTR